MSNNIDPTLNLITPVVDVYYYIPEYSHISANTEIIEGSISVGNFNVGNTIIDPTHCIIYTAFTTMYCKYYQHKWVMHRDDGPAYMTGERCGFYHNGTNFKIENIPIDNETKLMLALKYTPIMLLDSRYNWYDLPS